MSNFQSVIDDRGRPVSIPRNPQRIVSLICSITETLFELGLEKRITGRTNYCIRPDPAVDKVKKIGGPKNPDIDRILELNADLVIANREENEEKDIIRLENEGVPVFVTYPRSITESLELIKTLGAITGTDKIAHEWYERAERAIHKTREMTSTITARPSVIYLIWRKPYMTINKDTYIHDLISFCGGLNLYAENQDRYPEISIDDIVSAQPDIIVLPSEPFPFKKKHADEINRCKDIPAVRNNRVYLADGELFSWYGVRMIPGLPYVQRILFENLSAK